MATVTKPIVTDETAQEMLAELKKITNAVKRITLTITMKTVNDTPVTDEYVVVTNTATGTVLGRIQYNGQPVAIEVNHDTEYAVTGTQNSINTTGFYAPTTVTGIAQSDTNITIEYLEVSDMSSLEAVRIAIAQHPGEELLPLGTVVTINGRRCVLMNYGYPTLEGGTQKWGACFWVVNSADELPFDAAETTEATETYATSDLYYYGQNGTTYTLLDLQNGDLIPYDSYDKVYHNTYRDPTCSIVKYGCPLYKASAVRQYINSDSDEYGGWWSADHIGDSYVADFGAKKGWLSGFSALDISAIATVKIRTYNPYAEEMDEMFDKMFLPSATELYGVATNDDGSPWVLLKNIAPATTALPTNRKFVERTPEAFGGTFCAFNRPGLIMRTYYNKERATNMYNVGSGENSTYTATRGAINSGWYTSPILNSIYTLVYPAFWLC